MQLDLWRSGHVCHPGGNNYSFHGVNNCNCYFLLNIKRRKSYVFIVNSLSLYLLILYKISLIQIHRYQSCKDKRDLGSALN